MDDVLLVSRREALGDLPGEVERRARRKGSRGEALPERVSLDELLTRRWRLDGTGSPGDFFE